jgi:hypothetical protein
MRKHFGIAYTASMSEGGAGWTNVEAKPPRRRWDQRRLRMWQGAQFVSADAGEISFAMRASWGL